LRKEPPLLTRAK